MKTERPLSLLSFLSTALLFHLQLISTVGFLDTTAMNDTNYIRTSCQTTLYPELCYTSLSGYANAIQQDPARLARVAVGISLSKARKTAR